jgi:hypothetical protein
LVEFLKDLQAGCMDSPCQCDAITAVLAKVGAE